MRFIRGPYLIMATWKGCRLPVPGANHDELWIRAFLARVAEFKKSVKVAI